MRFYWKHNVATQTGLSLSEVQFVLRHRRGFQHLSDISYRLQCNSAGQLKKSFGLMCLNFVLSIAMRG